MRDEILGGVFVLSCGLILGGVVCTCVKTLRTCIKKRRMRKETPTRIKCKQIDASRCQTRKYVNTNVKHMVKELKDKYTNTEKKSKIY